MLPSGHRPSFIQPQPVRNCNTSSAGVNLRYGTENVVTERKGVEALADHPIPTQDAATRAFRQALRSLHLQAGKPSMRTIAAGIGEISHTTVHDTINGTRVPSWSNAERIVRYLGGDEAEFRELWISAAANQDRSGDLQPDRFLVDRYREQVIRYFSKMRIPGNHDPRRPDMTDFYIPHIVSSASTTKLPAIRFASHISTAILLGDPGSGKTTLCSWLMIQNAADPTADVPFYISLRNLIQDLPPQRSVAEFIDHEIDALYQLKAPHGFASDLLASGRTIVIFDGLDEVPETSRIPASSIIELFHATYPNCRILVTSRKNSYTPFQLDQNTFHTFILDSFSNPQIEQYVRNWKAHFGFAPRLPNSTTQSDSGQGGVHQLPSNPLLLALTCALSAEFASYIRTWPEVYERWVELLLKRWDASRAINLVRNDVVDRSAPLVLRNLAYEMVLGDLPTNVPEPLLLTSTGEYLRDKTKIHQTTDSAPDVYETVGVARDVVDFLSQRTGIFAQVGSTESGDRSYAFTQREFLEYFAASEIVQRARTPEELAPPLISIILADQWEMVPFITSYLAERVYENGSRRVVAELERLTENHSIMKKQGIIQFIRDLAG